MQRTESWLLWWMMLCFMFQNAGGQKCDHCVHCKNIVHGIGPPNTPHARFIMCIGEDLNCVIKEELDPLIPCIKGFLKATEDLRRNYMKGNHDNIVQAIMHLEDILENTDVKTILTDAWIVTALNSIKQLTKALCECERSSSGSQCNNNTCDFLKATEDLGSNDTKGNHDNIVQAIMHLEDVLENTDVNETTFFFDAEIVTALNSIRQLTEALCERKCGSSGSQCNNNTCGFLKATEGNHDSIVQAFMHLKDVLENTDVKTILTDAWIVTALNSIKQLTKALCERECGSSGSQCYNNTCGILKATEDLLEYILENKATFFFDAWIVAAVFNPPGVFNGLYIYASDSEVKFNTDVPDRKVKVHLPTELNVEQDDKIVFSKIHLPNESALIHSDKLYEGTLIGLSVRGKNISGLQDRVNITINITASINKTQEPQCVYLASEFKSDGCLTLWDPDQNEITCSCDHLTYFGVLLVSVSEETLSSVHQKILSYISIIGCSISLFALVITVLIFITKRELRKEDSKKIHISLSVALILLNLHFLPSEAVAAMSSTEFCFYMALGLHYSLLATFSWMALEGFHLYLLLVKVFNIYIRRYLLKLSVVGWGVPAVIVSVVVIIDTDYYGHVPLDVSNPSGSAICYLTNDTVKMVTTEGVFSLVFLFNVIMFGVIVRQFVAARSTKKVGHSERNAVKREIFTLLSLMVLLGVTWGLALFSFGPLTTPGLYAFSILNSLQGFFIFIYFMLSLKKTKDSDAKQSSQTQTHSSRT
ncbi:adhesion G-protein coupled receptor G2-like isoform X2 [Kryptolebias marmoratus]|uniref:adhesion G-protein coupled receptor G2-like isoform X2 n=1 Tax=Kryptolebias marmoratus TaxID=37003 RepID=UPI0018ACC64D|nr:adhesion G-protein coupled receptor G2-like isoform X2 [Kryptolebias marmoratus]